MEFVELCYRRLTGAGRALTPHDYIDWADQLLVQNSDSASIAQLASCAWDTPPDAQQVEGLFHDALAELGLALPADEYDAIKRYAIAFCEQFLSGAMEPWDLVREMHDLSEDNQEPYLFRIWTVLYDALVDAHLRVPHSVLFNRVLPLTDDAACIRRTASQFIVLCSMPLPVKFPSVWRCSECHAVDEDAAAVADASRTCRHCGTESASKNMSFFENRDAMIDEFSSPSSATISATP